MADACSPFRHMNKPPVRGSYMSWERLQVGNHNYAINAIPPLIYRVTSLSPFICFLFYINNCIAFLINVRLRLQLIKFLTPIRLSAQGISYVTCLLAVCVLTKTLYEISVLKPSDASHPSSIGL